VPSDSDLAGLSDDEIRQLGGLAVLTQEAEGAGGRLNKQSSKQIGRAKLANYDLSELPTAATRLLLDRTILPISMRRTGRS
jgi:hypothetical protein